MIIDQQLELHFGEDYEVVKGRANKYVHSVMSSTWLKRSEKNRASRVEGGIPGLRRLALLYIIEAEDDIDRGLSDFGNYVAREYGSTNRRSGDALNVSLKPFTKGAPVTAGAWMLQDIEEALSVDQPDEPLVGSPASISEALTERDDDVIQIPQDLEHFLREDKEKIFFQTIGDVGSIAEAIRLLGWDKKEAMRMWHRVHARVKRGHPST